jgi:hypothetical protein
MGAGRVGKDMHVFKRLTPFTLLALVLLPPAPARAASDYEAVVKGCGLALPPFGSVTFKGEKNFSRTDRSVSWQTPEGVAAPGDPAGISETCAGFHYYHVVGFGRANIVTTVNWDFARYPIGPRRLSCGDGTPCNTEADCVLVHSRGCTTRDGCGHGHMDYGVFRKATVRGLTLYTFTGGGGKDGERRGADCVFTATPTTATGHEFWGTDTVTVTPHPPAEPLLPVFTDLIVMVQAHSHGAVKCSDFLCFPGVILSVSQ